MELPDKRPVVRAAQAAVALLLLALFMASRGAGGASQAGAGELRRCKVRMLVCNGVTLPAPTTCKLLLDARASVAAQRSGGRRAAAAVPRIIHQSWKSGDLPERFQLWSQSWRDANPGWEYRLWTDADNRRLVERSYPWLLPVYDALPVPVMRADTARYLYMHAHGGVYADLDTWALRGMDNLTDQPMGQGAGALVGLMSEDTRFPHNIPNAWMASQPGHPFWLFAARVVAEVAARRLEADGEQAWGAEEATGPVVLKRAFDTWRCALKKEADVAALPAGYVFVSDWHNQAARAEFNAACDAASIASPEGQRRCLGRYPNAHVVTYWTHSWEEPPWEKKGN